MSTLQDAAQDLINQALQASTESVCNLLLQSAQRLEPSMSIDGYKEQWLAAWIKTNKNRKGAIYNDKQG